ncbi:YrhK family protein [Bacillus sp. B1-b2]|uniref:YrhK family protein n=1 Tax=Bacillus sp. B1-b2 TaxID=2653201 RepID=UPI00186A2DA3
MISIWYMIGSISFLLGSTSTVGYWFFIIGSIQLSLRPLIRIIHFKKYRKN